MALKFKLSTRNHQVELAKWNPDPRVLGRVKETGFDQIHLMHSLIRTDLNLFIALVRCYSLEEQCFIFGDTRIVPTLDDVLRIMGLPIDGKPVTGRDYGKNRCKDLCSELLGSPKYASGRSHTEISMKDILELKDVPEDADDVDIDVYVRGYVLHCIGCIVCPSMNPGGIPSMFLGLLSNVDELKDFAWGAAFLAQSMNHVHYLKKNIEKATTTGACIPFFMVFLFEHVKGMASACMRLNQIAIELPLEFPLIVSWSNLLAAQSKNNHGKLSIDVFVDLLHSMEVLPRPYERLDSSFLPPYLQSQLHIAYTHTVLVCFEQLAYHMPHVFPEKMGLDREDIAELKSLPEAKSMQRTAASKPDWAEKFKDQVSSWNHRRENYICSYHKLVELGVMDTGGGCDVVVHYESNASRLFDMNLNVEVVDVEGEVGGTSGTNFVDCNDTEREYVYSSPVARTWHESGRKFAHSPPLSRMWDETVGVENLVEATVGTSGQHEDVQINAQWEEFDQVEQENEGAILVSPNFNVDSQGLRRGRRPLQTPEVLKEGYELDRLQMNRIRSKRS